ncbi:DUF6236 family protein [Aquicoccus porphyridii]|uniref:DUF6236 family protein n=1 Tax=Aquicoccus porphyridii TaxID=1852029 RepID=UPI00273EE3BA|nr:DUF6236 family protein [Aquicoccus porphyridii]
MGEAKRRRLSEPHFGKRPKRGRGILLSAPIEFDGQELAVQNDIDPAELRRAALFWDRMHWPQSNIIDVQSNDDERFLEEEGILTRPTLKADLGTISWASGNQDKLIKLAGGSSLTTTGDVAARFAAQHIDYFEKIDNSEPGLWVLSEGPGSFYLKGNRFENGRGKLVELTRALPLPDPSFPLPELLEFKYRRSDEIVDLNFELDKFYKYVSNANDPDHELARLIQVIDRKLADVHKVAKESKHPFRLGSIAFSISAPSISASSIEDFANRTLAWELAGQTMQLPFVGGMIGAGASLIQFDVGLNKKQEQLTGNPFRVAASISEELIR